MNRIVTRLSLLLLALALCGQLHAQFTTTFAKNVAPGQNNGMYYSLPQTMLRLDFIIEETRFEKGPLSDYAGNYYEMADVVEYEDMEYRLLDVRMTPVASPDPNAMFFVTMTTSRGGGKVQFDVLPNGIIHSVGMGNTPEPQGERPMLMREPPHPEIDLADDDRGFIQLMTAGKTNAQLAKEVADKIEDIRKARFYLISGDVEMASNPETFRAMCQQLDAMEQEYMSLLVGRRVTKKVVRTIYVVPNRETPTQTIAKFSELEGLTEGTSGTGSMITVQTLSLNTTAAINAPSQSAVESMSYENKVFYRVPETANVRVMIDGRTIMEDRLVVNQLGALLTAPVNGSRLEFDPETGQIINIQ